MAKLKAYRRRRIRLRRVAVVALVIVALVAAAIGIVTLQIRPIVLSQLRKQLPNCEVSVGRVTLNPLSNLSIYDLKIVDRASPTAGSTIELEHVTAHFAIKSGLKFHIDLEAAGSEIVLHDVTGEQPPFPDLFARKPERTPSRFRLRRASVRDCHVTIDDASFGLDVVVAVQADGLQGLDAQPPADVALQLRDLVLTSGPIEFVDEPANTSPLAAATGEGSAVRIGLLEGTFGYDPTQPEALNRVLLRRVRARDGTVSVLFPDFKVGSRFALGLVNDAGSTSEQPSRLKAVLADFVMEAGSLRTEHKPAEIDADIAVRADGAAATLAGTFTLDQLDAALGGSLDETGLEVTALFRQHPAPTLVSLFIKDEERGYKIPFIHDIEELSGTIDRFELALSYLPERGFGLVGAVAANELDGKLRSMALEVEGAGVDTTFSLLPAEGGGPLELVVGGPDATARPGTLVAQRVTWASDPAKDVPGFPATEATGRLLSQDSNWYLTDILGVLFEGRGTGRIQALADGTVTLDLQFEGVNLAPLFANVGRKGDEMTGRADGTLTITMLSTPSGTAVQSLKGVLRTNPPGGRIKLKEKRESFDALPGGEQVLNTLKQQMSPRAFDHFLEKFKNYQYESITMDARKSGDEYLLDVKVRDADKKNPLPVDLTIRYSITHVYHEAPSVEEETRQ